MLRIGTSGIVLPGKKEDYPLEYRSESRLRYYSSNFNSIEINSTFYKLPMATTISKWSGEVFGDFTFTLKLWKEVTHAKKLCFEPENICRFMKIASNMTKSGCLLVQFPGSITSDYAEEVEEILIQIQKYDPEHKWQVAVELRNNSWYHELTWDMLDKYRASLVYHDIKVSKPPLVKLKSKVIYLRFHGPAGNYRDSYSESFLNDQAKLIRNWLEEGKEVYSYFNNTMGAALENARYLKGLFQTE